MLSADPDIESRLFDAQHGARVAIVGGGVLGSTLALRYRQAGRSVTLIDAGERLERRGHVTVASTDTALLALLEELNLAAAIRWTAPRPFDTRFGFLPGGRSRIVQTLRERGRAIGVDVRLGTLVNAVRSQRAGFEVVADGSPVYFDQVVLALPSLEASQLTATLPSSAGNSLAAGRYVGIVGASFVLSRPLGRTYIARVTRGSDRFTVHNVGAVHSAEEAGSKLVYVTRPLYSDHDLFQVDERAVIENLARALPGQASIDSARVMRTPHAFAVQGARTYGTPVPGLAIVNSDHFGNGRHHLERTAALATSAFQRLCAERIA